MSGNFDNFVPKSPLSLYSYGPAEGTKISALRNAKKNSSDKENQKNAISTRNSIQSPQKDESVFHKTDTTLESMRDASRKVQFNKPISGTMLSSLNTATSNVKNLTENVLQPQRTSMIRPSALYTASAKNVEEIHKLLKTHSDEIAVLKSEKNDFQKITDDLRTDLTCLTQIVTDISSRVMNLETRFESDLHNLENKTEGKFDTNLVSSSSENAAIGKYIEKHNVVESCINVSKNAEEESRLVNLADSSAVIPQKVNEAGDSLAAQRVNVNNQRVMKASFSLFSSNCRSHQDSCGMRNSPTFSGSNAKNDSFTRCNTVARRLMDDRLKKQFYTEDDMARVIALIENRIREDPEKFLYKALEIFDENSSFVAQSQGLKSFRSRKQQDNCQRNILNPLFSATIPSKSPSYSAKYTHKMTVEREFVYPPQTTEISNNENFQLNKHQFNEATHYRNQGKRSSKTVAARYNDNSSVPLQLSTYNSAADNEFFENDNGELNDNQHCNAIASKTNDDCFFVKKNVTKPTTLYDNHCQKNEQVPEIQWNESDMLDVSQHHPKRGNDIRERYRRRN